MSGKVHCPEIDNTGKLHMPGRTIAGRAGHDEDRYMIELEIRV
jgi:hypothetical protein